MIDFSQLKTVHVSEPARGEGAARGEAGLGHYRKALDGWVVDSAAAAAEICDGILDMMGILERVERIEFKSALKNKRGDYNRGTRTIRLFGHRRLMTLSHELAHHVTGIRAPFVKAHGKEFKRELRNVLNALSRVAGVNIAAEAEVARATIIAETPTFKRGDLVKSLGPKGRTFEIIGLKRTRYSMRCTETGGKFSGRASGLRLVGAH
jgi:hypothetical protein